jgi:hypothetical protein
MGQMIRGEKTIELLSIDCDCSETTIREALSKNWPPRDRPTYVLPLVITVHVAVHDFDYVRRAVMPEINGPLAPHVNLAIDYELRKGEWYVDDGIGQLIGSMGA